MSVKDIRAGGAVVELSAPGKQLDKDLKKAASIFDDFKKKLGEESGLKKTFDMLRGAGAVAGLTLAVQAIGEMAKRTAQWRHELDAGTKSMGDVVEEAWQALPIFGRIREAGLAIRDAFTGEHAALDEINSQSERRNSLMDAYVRIVERGTEGLKRMSEALRDIQGEGMLIGQKGPWLAWLTAQQAAARQQNDLRRKAEQDIQAIRKEATVRGLQGDQKVQPQKLEVRKRQLETQLSQGTYLSPRQMSMIDERGVKKALLEELQINGPQAGELARKQRELDAANRAELALLNQVLGEVAKQVAATEHRRDQAIAASSANLAKSARELASEFAAALIEGGAKSLAQAAQQQQGRIDGALEQFFAPVDGLIGQLEQEADRTDTALDAFFQPVEDMAQRLRQRGDEIRQAVASPWEEYRKSVDELAVLLRSGTIAQQDYAKAVGHAGEKLRGEVGPLGSMSLEQAIKNSQAAGLPMVTMMLTSAINEAMRNLATSGAQSVRGTFDATAMQSLASSSPEEKTARNTETMKKTLTDILRNIRANPGGLGVI